ncbi:signal recognition particle 9 kDa protein-like isoform X2 [Stegodyphus dumicola]|uniref:signal recognition particle 9 kDa protein-like isoform X2 n=1 Tax=Stegodyphus dumicola TaxID=202533 RepID=UPI0015A9035C|nr:signal recognition particle 9 kDa protein-like isoform X2 [Stegodyphus dumicola]
MGRICKSSRKIIYNGPYESKVRFTMKYRHCDGKLIIKITDNHTCLMYLTEHTQDVKKIEKLTSQLMRHMASKEK